MGNTHSPRHFGREGLFQPGGDEPNDAYDSISDLLREMGQALPQHGDKPEVGRDYIGVLLEENAQLRGLVVHLSKLVLQNIIGKK